MPADTRLQDEIHLKVLRQLEQNPDQTQRDLAEALGVSLGKTNYCIQALLAKGLLKIGNFHRQKNKRVYTYLLTPEGMAAKAALTARFLKRKMEEYDLLREEIQQLRAEVATQRQRTDDSDGPTHEARDADHRLPS